MTGAPPLRTARAAVPAAVPRGRQPLALAVLMVVLLARNSEQVGGKRHFFDVTGQREQPKHAT
jgi:hypothetical protein